MRKIQSVSPPCSPQGSSVSLFLLAVVMASIMAGCASTQPSHEPPVKFTPAPQLVRIPIVTSQIDKRVIPAGSKIVITNIAGNCATEVKDALMQRLVDNPDYDVLTRDNLKQILDEFDLTSSNDERLFRKFNSEAVSAIGELLGASYFIVGRVSYCGESSTNDPESKYGKQFNVHANLQILDLGTGKVLVSSASRGYYLPLPASSLPPGQLPGAAAGKSGGQAVETGVQPANGEQAAKGGAFKRMMNAVVPSADSQPAAQKQDDPTKKNSVKGKKYQVAESESEDYLKIRAAEAMANEFADKFFARSTWENVTMWNLPEEKFSQGLRHVQLGHCGEAVDFLGNQGAEKLEQKADDVVAKYLHNYGVAFLCNNEPEKATRKLQSAYRVAKEDVTLEMLALAARITEWSLTVEVDMEPEVGMLMRREIYSNGN